MLEFTLRVDERVKDKFLWLISHFKEVEVVDENIRDDEYLNKEIVNELLKARKEPIENGVSLEELKW